MYIIQASYFFSFSNFSKNHANFSGGGISFNVAVSGASLQHSRLEKNSAMRSGGGLELTSSNYGVNISTCTFSKNTVFNGTGGAINLASRNGIGLFLTDNEINLYNVTFVSNSATSGGSVSAFVSNKVSFFDSIFRDNVAVEDGGAVLMSGDSAVYINNTRFVNNKAGQRGGAILMLSRPDVYAKDVFISNNTAQSGGAMMIQTASLPELNGIFKVNSNTAKWGSAFCFVDVIQSRRDLHVAEIVNNKATIAGTMYWLCLVANCTEPDGIRTVRTLSSNQSPSGQVFATQAVQAVIKHKQQVANYLNPLSKCLKRKYCI